jgi:hypothetical protein
MSKEYFGEGKQAIINQMGRLVCPDCGHDYMNQIQVTIFNRGEDDPLVDRTVVDSTGTHIERIPNHVACNPSDRRHGMTIVFDCEGCAADEVSAVKFLHIYQHKGQTFTEWAEEAA